ncbi:hypothetical protein [Poseidonibacter antarcticus]|uniref:hypothetical protein n=1 Tax=Poseidonibacter antarcticus TaxID=2478538 RepID=UPI000EF493B7|nr:hypothetical protein [Poseidonibacter antarcticus]
MILKDIKGPHVIMIAIESGVAVYTVIQSEITYSKLSSLLMNNKKSLASNAFSIGIAYLTPPPATLIMITSISAAFITEYAIDKYVELNKRNYILIEDLLWNVPDEIKNKITILNIEKLKKNTIFDFPKTKRDTIFNQSNQKKSILESNSNTKSILNW